MPQILHEHNKKNYWLFIWNSHLLEHHLSLLNTETLPWRPTSSSMPHFQPNVHIYIHFFSDFSDKWLEKINHSTVIPRVNEVGESCSLFLETVLTSDTVFPYEQLK